MPCYGALKKRRRLRRVPGRRRLKKLTGRKRRSRSRSRSRSRKRLSVRRYHKRRYYIPLKKTRRKTYRRPRRRKRKYRRRRTDSLAARRRDCWNPKLRWYYTERCKRHRHAVARNAAYGPTPAGIAKYNPPANVVQPPLRRQGLFGVF